MHREKILETAHKLVSEDRNRQYGEPEVNLKLAGLLKHVFWKHATRDISPAEHEAIDMVLTKLSRIGTGTYKDDNYIDAAGYIAIAGQMAARYNIIPGPGLDPSKLEDTPLPIQHPMTFGRYTLFCPIPGREEDFRKCMEHAKSGMIGNIPWDKLDSLNFTAVQENAEKLFHAPIDDRHPLRRHGVRLRPTEADRS